MYRYKILIVDDEEAVRDITRETLRTWYVGRENLERFTARQGRETVRVRIRFEGYTDR